MHPIRRSGLFKIDVGTVLAGILSLNWDVSRVPQPREQKKMNFSDQNKYCQKNYVVLYCTVLYINQSSAASAASAAPARRGRRLLRLSSQAIQELPGGTTKRTCDDNNRAGDMEWLAVS